MTQSRASANACSDSAAFVDRQRGVGQEGGRPRGARSAAPSSSTVRRESQKTSRFSPAVQGGDDLGGVVEGADVVELDLARAVTGRSVGVGRTAPGATTCAGRLPAPDALQPGSSSSGLPTVADSPIRCMGRPASRVSRSSTASRCQPRSSPANACTSSTTTARTPAKNCAVVDVGADQHRLERLGRGEQDVRAARAGCAAAADASMSPCQSAARRPSQPAYVLQTRASRLLSRALSGQR